MSPVSRGRKPKKRKSKNTRPTRRPDQDRPFRSQAPCDCPVCSGHDGDIGELVDDVVAGAAGLMASDDPLDAELLVAAIVSIAESAGPVGKEALIEGLVPELEERAGQEALAVLLAIGSVVEGQAGKEARAAADALTEAGLTRLGGRATRAGDGRRLQAAA